MEKKLAEIEIKLTDATLYEPENKKTLQDYLLSQAKIKQGLEDTENAWLEACEKYKA